MKKLLKRENRLIELYYELDKKRLNRKNELPDDFFLLDDDEYYEIYSRMVGVICTINSIHSWRD